MATRPRAAAAPRSRAAAVNQAACARWRPGRVRPLSTVARWSSGPRPPA